MRPTLLLIAAVGVVFFALADYLTIKSLKYLHDNLIVRILAGVISIILGFAALDWLWTILNASSGEGRYMLIVVELVMIKTTYITVWWIVARVKRTLGIRHGRATVMMFKESRRP